DGLSVQTRDVDFVAAEALGIHSSSGVTASARDVTVGARESLLVSAGSDAVVSTGGDIVMTTGGELRGAVSESMEIT